MLKAKIASELYFLMIGKLSKGEYERFVINNPDDEGTINTDLGSSLYYQIEDMISQYIEEY